MLIFDDEAKLVRKTSRNNSNNSSSSNDDDDSNNNNNNRSQANETMPKNGLHSSLPKLSGKKS